MSRIELNQPAPDFILDDYRHVPFRLSSHLGQIHILLAFNRGFV